MDKDSFQFNKLASSLPKMSASTVNSMFTPQMKEALSDFCQNYSSVALNASAQAVSIAYKSVLSDLRAPEVSSSVLSRFSQVLSEYSPVVEAARDLVVSSNYALFRSLSEQSLSAAKAVASSSQIAQELSSSLESLSDDDFVTFNEDSIKEWEFPDTIAIPAGNKRIRMKTEIFIAILSGVVIPVLLWIAGQIVDFHDAYTKSQTESQRLEIEQEYNDLIRESNHLFSQYIDLLTSTDASNSSRADQIESLKESLPEPGSAPTASDLAHGHLQKTHNNSPE